MSYYSKLLNKRLAKPKDPGVIKATENLRAKRKFTHQEEVVYNYVKDRYNELGDEAKKKFLDIYNKQADTDKDMKRIMARLLKEIE